MKQKKKLPRYWLGTRKPTGLGYQPNRGIGDTTFNTQKGISVQPEANAMRQNQLPNALGKLSSAAQYPMQMLQNLTPALLTTEAANAFKTAGSQILPTSTKNWAIGTALKEVGKKAPTKAGLNTIGTTAGALGTAWGLYNIGSDIAHAGDTISQGQIANSAATNTITTAGGNTYTERGGLDAQGIMDYEHQMSTAKKVGLTTDAVGLGASAGGLVGSIVPGVGTVLGTGIGAGLGLLAGGVASLLGFGDNEEEVEQMMRDQEDVFAMQNRQNRATALDKDTKAEFYNRQNGVLGAANGKQPCFSIGKSPNARVSNGEGVGVMDNFGKILDIEWIPGKPNNEDNVKIHLPDNKYLHSFVISNKHNLSEKAKINPYAALKEQAYLQNTGQMNNRYKNGKLPGYENGLWKNILGALPYVAPHAISLFGNNLSQLHRAENASVYAPDVYIDNPEGAKAVNELAQLRFDADPYYREAQRGLNWANYNTRRNVGLGQGGRAIAEATNYANYLRGLSDITKMYNEAQNGYAEKYAAALAQLGSTNQGRRMEAAAKRHAWMQQAMGQRESWIAQYRKNIDQNLLNAAADYMRYGQYRDALGIQNKQLSLWDRQTAVEEKKLQNMFPNQETYAQSVKPTDAFDSYSSLPWWKKNDIIGRSARYYNATGQLG